MKNHVFIAALNLIYSLASFTKFILYLVVFVYLIIAFKNGISITTFIELKPVTFFILFIIAFEIITNFISGVLHFKKTRELN